MQKILYSFQTADKVSSTVIGALSCLIQDCTDDITRIAVADSVSYVRKKRDSFQVSSGIIVSLNLSYNMHYDAINSGQNKKLSVLIWLVTVQGIAYLRFTHTKRQLSFSLDYFVLKIQQCRLRATPPDVKNQNIYLEI